MVDRSLEKDAETLRAQLKEALEAKEASQQAGKAAAKQVAHWKNEAERLRAALDEARKELDDGAGEQKRQIAALAEELEAERSRLHEQIASLTATLEATQAELRKVGFTVALHCPADT